jgi:hypothetical protein
LELQPIIGLFQNPGASSLHLVDDDEKYSTLYYEQFLLVFIVSPSTPQMNGVNWVISESRMIMILSFLTDEVVF